MLLNEALGLDFRQPDVDFIIPNLEEDLRLYVDPYLFYKSANPRFQAVHARIQRFFEVAIAQIKDGREGMARRMLVFPEVPETMLGLSKGSHRGRGLGAVTGEDRSRGDVIFREIVNNPDILEHGIQHLSEMQLLIDGVGFDMVSDMCTNIAKDFFIQYTQEQAKLHGIPLEPGLNLEHVFDWEELVWDDALVDLPANPANGRPILLVPKAVARRFAEIDYKDFWHLIYRYILRHIEVQRSLQAIGRQPRITWREIEEKYPLRKAAVVAVLHENPSLKRQYLARKDQEMRLDPPPLDLRGVPGSDQALPELTAYLEELRAVEPGRGHAKRYERLMIRILNRLFSPQLRDPHSQVVSVDGREIIDITFMNAATAGFWSDVKQRYGNALVVFELKNMADLGNEEYQQLSSRLSDIKGMFGVLVARRSDHLDLQRAYRRLHQERKVILTLTDEDITKMLEDTANGLSPTMHMQHMHRVFLEES